MEKTGYHVGNALEREALGPAENMGEEEAEGSSGRFQGAAL